MSLLSLAVSPIPLHLCAGLTSFDLLRFGKLLRKSDAAAFPPFSFYFWMKPTTLREEKGALGMEHLSFDLFQSHRTPLF
jgi:hypothetical protein